MMLTRRLPPDEFAAYQLLRTGVTLAAIFGDGVNFWALRNVARNRFSWYNFPVLSSLFSPLAFIVVYAATSYVYGWEPGILALVFILSVVMLVRGGLLGSVYAIRPINIVRGGLIFELMKVLMTYVFVVYMRQGVPGVFISLIIAFVAEISVASFRTFPLATYIDRVLMKAVAFKLWVPLTTRFSNYMALLDVYLVSYVLGNIVLSGYYRIVYSLANIIGFSSAIGMALYPYLIRDEVSAKEVREIWKSAIALAAPLCLGVSLSINHVLYLLNPRYEWLSPLGPLVAFVGLLLALHILANRQLLGIERADEHELKAGGYISIMPKLYLIQNGSYMIALYIIFSNWRPEDFTSILFWLTVYLISLLLGFLVKVYLLRKKGAWPLSKDDVKWIVVASAVGGVPLYMVSMVIRPVSSAVYQALNLSILAIVGGGIYLLTLLALDKEVREWAVSLLRLLLSGKSGRTS